MKSAGRPPNESRRLAALRESDVLDTSPEEEFDAITRLASRSLGVSMVLVSLVDDERQWFKSHHGLPVRETPRDVSFCAHAVEAGRELIVPDASKDPRFADNPLVEGAPYIRFYAGIPLRSAEGDVLGTLCALDREPRGLDEDEHRLLADLAEQVERQLELRRRLATMGARLAARVSQRPPRASGKVDPEVEATLRAAREKDELLRLVVHDIKSPLTIIMTMAKLLRRDAADEEEDEGLACISQAASSIHRMVLDLVDVTNNDGELVLHRREVDVAALAHRTVRLMGGLLQAKGQTLRASVSDDVGPCSLDEGVVSRVLQNLIENAHKYAPAGSSVELRVELEASERIRFTVTDQGPGIPTDERERIFRRSVRLDRDRAGAAGEGLGLSFCRLAARAHGGELDVVDAAGSGGAAFRLTLPRT